MREKGRASDDVRDYHPALKPWGVTPREAEVARLVKCGYSNAEAGEDLGIDVRTVKGHVHQLFGKLVVRRRGLLIGEVDRIVGEFREARERNTSAADAGLRLVERGKSPKPARRPADPDEKRRRGQA